MKVFCFDCGHFFGEDVNGLYRKVKEEYRTCPKCKKPLDLCLGDKIITKSGFDSVVEIDLNSKDAPDPNQAAQLLRDAIESKMRKRKRWWQFWK